MTGKLLKEASLKAKQAPIHSESDSFIVYWRLVEQVNKQGGNRADVYSTDTKTSTVELDLQAMCHDVGMLPMEAVLKMS